MADHITTFFHLITHTDRGRAERGVREPILYTFYADYTSLN